MATTKTTDALKPIKLIPVKRSQEWYDRMIAKNLAKRALQEETSRQALKENP